MRHASILTSWPTRAQAAAGISVVVTLLAACAESPTAPPEPADKLASALALSTANPGTWAYRASAPTQRADAGAGVINNLFYVVGGHNDNTSMRRLEAYNPTTNTWTRKAGMPQKRDRPAAKVVGGKLYVVGGLDSAGRPRATLYVYTPSSNSWARKADMPRATSSAIAGVINGRIYAVTGDYNTFPQRLYRYDPATNTWSRRADLPSRDHRGGAGAVVGGKLYVVWGLSPTVDAYDPTTNTWSLRLTMSPADWGALLCGASFENCWPRFRGSRAVAMHGRLYLLGGVTDDGGNEFYKPYLFEYNPGTNVWSRKADMRQRRGWHATGVVTNPAGVAQVIVTGGQVSELDDSYTTTTEVWLP